MIAPLGENMTTLANSMKKNPDTLITVYRGAPKIQKDNKSRRLYFKLIEIRFKLCENGMLFQKK